MTNGKRSKRQQLRKKGGSSLFGGSPKAKYDNTTGAFHMPPEMIKLLQAPIYIREIHPLLPEYLDAMMDDVRKTLKLCMIDYHHFLKCDLDEFDESLSKFKSSFCEVRKAWKAFDQWVKERCSIREENTDEYFTVARYLGHMWGVKNKGKQAAHQISVQCSMLSKVLDLPIGKEEHSDGKPRNTYRGDIIAKVLMLNGLKKGVEFDAGDILNIKY